MRRALAGVERVERWRQGERDLCRRSNHETVIELSDNVQTQEEIN